MDQADAPVFVVADAPERAEISCAEFDVVDVFVVVVVVRPAAPTGAPSLFAILGTTAAGLLTPNELYGPSPAAAPTGGIAPTAPSLLAGEFKPGPCSPDDSSLKPNCD